ncbi:MAG: SurA N-terminal domain-containing protein [Burkholderiales bacterium]
MFDWVEKHKRWIQLGLLILIVPSFAFFGINYYFDEYGNSGEVAKVAGTKISAQEFDNALRERQEQLRQMMKDKADPAFLDSMEVRNAVINGLVDKRALLAHALHSGMAVTDQQVQKVIAEIPYFKDEKSGQFSPDRFTQILKSQGMTPVMFEDRVRQDLRLAQSRDAVTNSLFLPDAVVGRLGRIREQQREVSQWVLSPEQALSRVTVTDEEIAKHYDENKNAFRIPERVRVEYLTLTPESAAKNVMVTEGEILDYFKSHAEQYSKPEERRASHILISVPKDASAAAKDDARKKAQQILDQLKAAPTSFGELAKKHSQDPGSAVNGGDLGFFGRGAMVKAFDEAVFGLKAIGEIAGPVETQYGFHIIRLDAIKPGETTPLDQVRPAIEAELKKPKLTKAFADVADTFQELVFAQSDSLKPAAETLKLQIQTSDWLTKDGGGDPLIAKSALLPKIFSEDSIKNRRNTDAVEVSQNTMISARVIEHKESSLIPLEDVKSDVRRKMQLDKATKLIAEEGKATLDRLLKGDDKGVTWSSPALVSLEKPGDVQAQAARDVFGADPSKLPAYSGLALPTGRYVIYRVSKVLEAPEPTAEQRKELAAQLRQITAQQQFDAYLQAVKASAGVQIDNARIEKKQQ